MGLPIVGFTGPPENRRLYGMSNLSAFRRGGIGVVYEAELLADHLEFAAGTKVGLKLLTGVDAARFAKLSSRTAVLREHPHPYLARVVESFVGPPVASEDVPEEDATLYFSVHEWVEGTPLAHRIAEATDREIFTWMTDVAEAVDHLHSLPGGFAHRDIHTRNIIIRPDGHAALIDFDTILWGEGHDTVLTTLNSAPRLLQAAGASVSQAQDRSMVALTLLRALARDSSGTSDIAELMGTSTQRFETADGLHPSSRAGETVVGLLLRSIRQPPAKAVDIVASAQAYLEQPPRRRQRIDVARELALLDSIAPQPRRRTAWIVAIIAVALLVTGLTIALTRDPKNSDRPVLAAAKVAPAFQCWNGAKVFRFSQCTAPNGMAGISWVYPTTKLRNQSCSAQMGPDLYLAFCSFADMGIDPIPGVYLGNASGTLGGGISVIGPATPSDAAASEKLTCAHVCRPWIVDGEVAGRIDIEHAKSQPDQNSWQVSEGPANLTRVYVSYAKYGMSLDFSVTDMGAVPKLLKALHPRPPSQMRGMPAPGPHAFPCWNGFSALSLADCAPISGVPGLQWSLPGIATSLQRCENVSNPLGPQWWCQTSEIDFTGPAATDVRETDHGDDPGAGIQIGIWNGATTGASQIVTQPGARVVREPWMIDGKRVGTLVWSYTTGRLGGVTLDAGYDATPVWVRLHATRKSSLTTLLNFMRPQLATTSRG